MANTSSDTAPSKGIIYVATGRDYFDLACDSADSVQRTNPGLEIDLYTDVIGGERTHLFSQIHQLDTPHVRSKLDCKNRSRFERTLYLDCDTRVVAPLGDVFDLLDRFDLAMAHDVRRKSELIQQGWREKTPYCFPQLNAGVVLYKKSPRTHEFFQTWQEDYRRSGLDRDQVSLKDLLWKSDIRFYVLPPEFNLRRMPMLDAWEPLDVIPTIIHSHIFLQHLRIPGAKKVTCVSELIEIERKNLKLEWQAEGFNDDDNKWF